MSNLSEFLEAQPQNIRDGTLKAGEASFRDDEDAAEVVNHISMAMTKIAMEHLVEEMKESDLPGSLIILQAIFSASHGTFDLGFELGRRWAEAQRMEAEHAL